MMGLTITLRPETEAALKAKADAQGEAIDVYAASLIDLAIMTDQEEQIRQRNIEHNQPLIALLESWAAETDEDEIQEQRETLEYLEKVVDEDRPGQRSIFGTGYNPYLPGI